MHDVVQVHHCNRCPRLARTLRCPTSSITGPLGFTKRSPLATTSSTRDLLHQQPPPPTTSSAHGFLEPPPCSRPCLRPPTFSPRLTCCRPLPTESPPSASGASVRSPVLAPPDGREQSRARIHTHDHTPYIRTRMGGLFCRDLHTRHGVLRRYAQAQTTSARAPRRARLRALVCVLLRPRDARALGVLDGAEPPIRPLPHTRSHAYCRARTQAPI
jgi:hypothetical protein